MQNKVTHLKSNKHNIAPISGLKTAATTIAQTYDDKGAIIITRNDDGNIRIGTNGLTPNELRECLCTAIHYSFVFEN